MEHHVYVPFPGMSGPWWESSFIVTINVYFSHAAVWCPITFTFALIILWTSFLHEECKWAPTERSVSSICLVLTGRSWSRAAWAVLTCHQNTVLGFSTMGPGAGSGWPRLEPPALHTERYEVTTGGSHVSVCHSRFLISVGIFGM